MQHPSVCNKRKFSLIDDQQTIEPLPLSQDSQSTTPMEPEYQKTPRGPPMPFLMDSPIVRPPLPPSPLVPTPPILQGLAFETIIYKTHFG
jgi:hypothetical protein